MGEMQTAGVGAASGLDKVDDFSVPGVAGVPPPPRPSAIRWPAALRCGGMVAGGAAIAFVMGSIVPGFSLVSFLLIFGAAGLSLTLYRRAAPESLMSGPIGARIGLATGLLLVTALTLALAAIGVVARFRLHAMGPFDAQWAVQLQLLTERTVSAGQGAAGQGSGPGAGELAAMIARPEFRAWSTIASVVLLGVLLLGLTTGSGALVGSLGRAMRGKAE